MSILTVGIVGQSKGRTAKPLSNVEIAVKESSHRFCESFREAREPPAFWRLSFGCHLLRELERQPNEQKAEALVEAIGTAVDAAAKQRMNMEQQLRLSRVDVL